MYRIIGEIYPSKFKLKPTINKNMIKQTKRIGLKFIKESNRKTRNTKRTKRTKRTKKIK